MTTRLALLFPLALALLAAAPAAAREASADEPYYTPPPEAAGPSPWVPAAPGAAAPADAVVVAAAPRYSARAAVLRALFPFHRQIGLGARIVFAYHQNGVLGFGQGGIAAELLFRAHPHLTTELSLQYLATGATGTGYERGDIPLLLSQRVNLRGPGAIFAPYLVAGVGIGYGRLVAPGGLVDQGAFVHLQGGGGLEVRLGRFAALGADLRLGGRLRVDDNPRLVMQDGAGGERELLGSELGVSASLTAAGYF